MKILIPFQIKDIGGPSTFAKKFKEGLELRGHEVVFEETDDYDVLFVIVQAPFPILMRAKKMKKTIIQRLDGVYYWSVSGWRYPLLNLKARLIRHLFTDYTIYQSRYSKKCVEYFLGHKKNENFSIVYNGVDIEKFSPTGETISLRNFPEQKIFFTASSFRRKDQIKPLLEVLTYYANHYNKNFKFVIAGGFSGELQDFASELSKYPWVEFIGKVSNHDLPKYERASDIFLFTHLNPPCPNNIIEAMACGLPICGVADGAMSEITTGSNALLIESTGEAFWRERVYDIKNFSKNIDTIIKNQTSFSKKSRELAVERFSLQTMVDQYELVLKNFSAK